MEQQPNLTSLEHSEKGHSERALKSVNFETEDNNAELREAREKLLNNDELYARFFQAIKDKESMDATGFAHVGNQFIEFCQNLSEADIESIVAQFNRGLNFYASKNMATLTNFQRQPENIKRREIKPQGIVSVIEFMRSRSALMEISPETQYGFYIEDTLDAKYKIDLIECVFAEEDGNLIIDTMNLIQVKSSDPKEEENRKILDGHRSWVNSVVLDYDTFKREYTEGIPDEIPIQTLANNRDETISALLELATDPAGYDPEDFIKKLGIDNLTNKNKAWLLSYFISFLTEHVNESVNQGVITRESADKILERMKELEDKYRVKAKLPKKILRVMNINSIITVGNKIVEQEVIKARSENPDFDKIMKYN